MTKERIEEVIKKAENDFNVVILADIMHFTVQCRIKKGNATHSFRTNRDNFANTLNSILTSLK